MDGWVKPASNILLRTLGFEFWSDSSGTYTFAEPQEMDSLGIAVVLFMMIGPFMTVVIFCAAFYKDANNGCAETHLAVMIISSCLSSIFPILAAVALGSMSYVLACSATGFTSTSLLLALLLDPAKPEYIITAWLLLLSMFPFWAFPWWRWHRT